MYVNVSFPLDKNNDGKLALVYKYLLKKQGCLNMKRLAGNSYLC